ncbi:MAG: hypothetical protein ABI834_08055 [Ginsengibacter sp.]
MSGTKWLQKQEHFDWMQKCLNSWKTCEELISWNIQNGKYLNTINACRDVAEMCSQCIKFEAQRSPFFQQLCEVCAEICEGCAVELEKFESENGIFMETINSCRTFASACREVAEKQTREQTNFTKVTGYKNKSKKNQKVIT